MQDNSFKTYPLLRPLSWLYSLITTARNRRFDNGRLKIESFDLPIISVGNLSAGGTGKTPMCAYLLQLLADNSLQPALLSRGYGRKTKGFRCVQPDSLATEVGDEPLELYRRFSGKTPIFVCENRCEGARRILSGSNNVDALILDDAFQHRYIHRDLNIMLTDYHRLYTRDRVLPEGLLRESRKGASRADIIIVTKCPTDLSIAQAEEIRREICPRLGQHLFFAKITYAKPVAAFATRSEQLLSPNHDSRVLVFTGIAKAEPLLHYYKERFRQTTALRYPDHHFFSAKELHDIAKVAERADLVVTTAKDFQRLPDDLPVSLKAKLLVQHISVELLFKQGPKFDSLVMQTIDSHKQQHA